jgi:heme/copper-type cytochrome/quinol oxidase subunit 2
MRLSFADGLFWTSVACCVIAQLFIIRSVRGARYVPEPSASMPRQRGGLELLWAVLPAVGLAVLMVFTWRAVQRSASPTPANQPAPLEVPA